MRLDIDFYGPYFRRPTRPTWQLPGVRIDQDGRFRFGKITQQHLGLRAGHRILFGADAADPRDWYLCSSLSEGFVLDKLSQGMLGFSSAALRRQLLATLLYAPQTGGLRIQLDEVPVYGPHQETIWPLLTAPFYLAPAREQAAQLPDTPTLTRHRRQAQTLL